MTNTFNRPYPYYPTIEDHRVDVSRNDVEPLSDRFLRSETVHLGGTHYRMRFWLAYPEEFWDDLVGMEP
jgi:hypothetical protein